MLKTERDIIKCILDHKSPPRFPRDGIHMDIIPWEHSELPEGGNDWYGEHWTNNERTILKYSRIPASSL